MAAIRYAHKLAGLDTPTDDERVKPTVRGIRRTLGTARFKKGPATAERLLAMAANPGAGLKGLRDRALLLLPDAPGPPPHQLTTRNNVAAARL